MTARLTPALALDHLLELSPDIREGVILTAAGVLAAGSPALAGPARNLIGAADADQVEVRSDRGGVFAARSAHHSVAIVTRRGALPATVFYDLRTVLDQLDASAPGTTTGSMPQ